VWILEHQEPDEERIHEKNLERTKGRIHEIVRKRMEEWFQLKKRISDGSRKERRTKTRKEEEWIQVDTRNIWKVVESGSMEKRGRMEGGYWDDFERSRVESRSMEGRGKDREWILEGSGYEWRVKTWKEEEQIQKMYTRKIGKVVGVKAWKEEERMEGGYWEDVESSRE
jgi:hypothetical protein